jgi:predicted RNA-binding protein YlxR (DUF448 family)
LRQDGAKQQDAGCVEAEETGPMRRCALTRERRPKEDLLRFVLGPGGDIVPDLKERLPGRGVWLTAARDCVAEAAKKNVFARALKTEVTVRKDLAAQVDRLLTDAALGALGLANKAGGVVFGNGKVEDALSRGRVIGLIHAKEAANDGCRKLDAKFGAQGVKAGNPAIRTFSADELGLASGRTNVIHAALIQGGAAANFVEAAKRVERYRGGGAAFATMDRDTDRE